MGTKDGPSPPEAFFQELEGVNAGVTAACNSFILVRLQVIHYPSYLRASQVEAPHCQYQIWPVIASLLRGRERCKPCEVN